MTSNTSVERICFRLKDLITFIRNKNTEMKIFYHYNEIDYDKISVYMNYYIEDIDIGKLEDDTPCFNVTVNESIELIYIPNIF